MILITGASSGLGFALAKQYDKDGEPLFLSGRDNEKLIKTVDEMSSSPAFFAANLAKPTAISNLFDRLVELPSTVIHCAGSGYFGAIEDQQTDKIESLIENNLTSTIYLLRELIQRYQDEKVTVVVVMSTAAQVAKAGESTYCAVKWAVKGLLESLRLELKGKAMKLVAVYPGGMATEFWQSSGKAIDTSTFMKPDDAARMLKQAITSAENGYVSDITINRA